MLTLLRKYPLAGSASSMATPEDEEACRMDFDPKATSSTQVSRKTLPFEKKFDDSFYDECSKKKFKKLVRPRGAE